MQTKLKTTVLKNDNNFYKVRLNEVQAKYKRR